MERFRIGDQICIIRNGQKEEGICIILDILEDYDDRTYWLKTEKGTLVLEMETRDVKFEKITSEEG